MPLLSTPPDLTLRWLRSFPEAKTVAERFALVDALFAQLHASSGRLWLASIGDPTGRGVRVIVGADPDAEATSESSSWAGSTQESIDRRLVDEHLAEFGATVELFPVSRAELRTHELDVDAPSVLEQLRLLEQTRLPAQIALVVDCQRVEADRGRDELHRQLGRRGTSAELERRVSVEQWLEHHRAESASNHLTDGMDTGLWSARVTIAAQTDAAVGRATAAVNGGLRVLGAIHLRDSNDGPGEVVSSRFLSSLGVPPFGEVPGFRSTPMWFFDQTQELRDSPNEAQSPIILGRVLTPLDEPGGTFVLDRQNLLRHTLVTGATGSGKTESVKTLVSGVSREFQTPWLIVEPAKSEYRHMRLGSDGDRGPIVLRPGDPKAVPVRFNPLEPHPGFALRTHVDLVLALFQAAFDPVEPLPQVLAAALHRVYDEAGWNIATDDLDHSSGPVAPDDYPSLGDLQRTASEVVSDIGYEGEVRSNVAGFVDVRLGSLRLGTAGGMLERGYPVDFAALMTSNVVIELDDVGNDQEKSFLMGVVLVRLYEYLRVQMDKLAEAGITSRPLSHVTVVEEAHRLLRAALPGEQPNFAVESFANMLAEFRAYGEGLVVVEQVPSKIISDAVKNTGTKILHRLPAFDDREFAGMAANVGSEDLDALGSLRPGVSICFTDQMDRPCRVAVDMIADVDPADGEVEDRTPRSAAELVDRGSVGDGAVLDELRQIATAERRLDRLPLVELWVELAVMLAASAQGQVLPTAELGGDLGQLSAVELQALIQRTLTPRRTDLRRFGRPEDIAANLLRLIESAAGDRGDPTIELFDSVRPELRSDRLTWGPGRTLRATRLLRAVRSSNGAATAQAVSELLYGRNMSQVHEIPDGG